MTPLLPHTKYDPFPVISFLSLLINLPSPPHYCSFLLLAWHPPIIHSLFSLSLAHLVVVCSCGTLLSSQNFDDSVIFALMAVLLLVSFFFVVTLRERINAVTTN